MHQTNAFADQQSMTYYDEAGAPNRSFDSCNPDRKRGWQWVIVPAVVTKFVQSLRSSSAATHELLGNAFGGIVVSDRFSPYSHLANQKRQLCWSHVIHALTDIAERQGTSAEFEAKLLDLQHQLFDQWHQWKHVAIDWTTLQLAADRSARRIWPRCSGWWSWATSQG